MRPKQPLHASLVTRTCTFYDSLPPTRRDNHATGSLGWLHYLSHLIMAAESKKCSSVYRGDTTERRASCSLGNRDLHSFKVPQPPCRPHLTLRPGVEYRKAAVPPVVTGGLFSLNDPWTLGLLQGLPESAGFKRAKELTTMTRRCELTGKLPLSGQLRSHAENATKRKVPSEPRERDAYQRGSRP